MSEIIEGILRILGPSREITALYHPVKYAIYFVLFDCNILFN
jgi:hypothetical protein